MDEVQQKLNALLADPEMMGKVMNMVQSLAPQTSDSPPTDEGPPASGLDAGAIQAISSIMGKTGIDGDQKRLLQALRPYMSQQRIGKLEKAMRSARLAAMATTFLGKDLF